MEEQEADDTTVLEEEVQEMLNELEECESADKIRGEFKKLIHALKETQEDEKRLREECRELNAKVVSSSTKVAAALKLTQEDETTVTSLKQELDKVWKMVDDVQDTEKKDSETVRVLREELSKLRQQSEEQTDINRDSELFKKVEELTEERDELMAKEEDLRKRLNEACAAQQEQEAQKENGSQKLAQLQQELLVQQNNLSSEVIQKEKLDKEIKKVHTNMEAKSAEIKSMSLQVQKAKDEQQGLELEVEELMMLNDRTTQQLEQMEAKKNKLQQEFKKLSLTKERLSVENQQITDELKMGKEELHQVRQEISKEKMTRETMQMKFWQMLEQKTDVEVQMEVLDAKTAALERDLEAAKKQVEIEKKAEDKLIRERDILIKNVKKAVQSREKQQNFMKLLEEDKRRPEEEIRGYQQEAQKQHKIIQQLEKERDSYIAESSILMQKVHQGMDDVKVKDVKILELKKTEAEAKGKLKQQESLLQSVTSERNLCSKRIAETQYKITELKKTITTMNNQVSRNKEEIGIKHQELARSQDEQERLDKENENLREKLQSTKLQLEETMKHLDSQKAEQQKLQKIISDNDSEYIRLKRQLQQVKGEQDLLSKKLLNKNDERSQLYEKIRIQLSILAKGNFHYKRRQENLRLLKLEMKRLQCKESLMDRTMPNIEELRQKQIHLQKELSRERLRNRACEKQLKPVNVHRWRQLKLSEPAKFMIIQKIQFLQKRLITKTKELEKQDLLLQEKEKLYLELKHILARRPGPEAAEQLLQYEYALRDRCKKLKALKAELKTVDSKISKYKSENQRLSSELAKIQKKDQKKLSGEQRTRPKLEQLEPPPQPSSGTRSTGGCPGIP